MLSEIPGLHHFDVYLDAFAELNSSEIAAAVLTLGVLLFAVVTAIMLVRTRLRASAADAASRDEMARIWSSFQDEALDNPQDERATS